MGLDEIISGFEKLDTFILEKHIQVANLANDYLGKSNYQLAGYAAYIPPILMAGKIGYNVLFAQNHQSSAFDIAAFALSVYIGFQMKIINEEVERKEAISLESMAQDFRVAEFKEQMKESRRRVLAITPFISTLYGAIASIAPDFNPMLNIIPLLSGLLPSAYFSSIAHTPKKKGKIREAIENTTENLAYRLRGRGPATKPDYA